MTTEHKSKPLSQANLSEGHVYITPFRHLLPKEVIGSSKAASPAKKLVTLWWRHERTETDVPSHENGRPRTFFRDRTLIPRFLADSGATVGDVVVFKEIGILEFRLHLVRPDGSRIS